MIPPEEPEQYRRHSFLLSIWQEGHTAPWRASLRAVDTETRVGFATIEQLVTFLIQFVAVQSSSETEEAGLVGDTPAQPREDTHL